MHTSRIALAVLALALAACSKTSKKTGPVVAEGGGVAVTAEEFKAKLEEQAPFVRARYATLERKKEFLENLIRFELLAKEAEKKGLDKDPEVQATLKKIMVQKLVREAFEGEAPPDDAAVKAYYDEHQEEFVKPERVRAALVWLRATHGSPERAAKGAEARKLLARIRAEEQKNPLAFSNVAREASEDLPTKAAGGDLGYRSQAELEAAYAKEVAAAAFGLEDPGQVSSLVETAEGFAIVKLMARQPGVNRPLDEVKSQLAARISREKRTKDFDAYVKKLREGSGIEVNDAELEKIVVAGAVPTQPPPEAVQPAAAKP